jgi:hypothetical protein
MFGIVDSEGVMIGAFTAPLQVHSNRPVFMADSMSLKRYVSYRGGAQRWEIEAGIMPMKEEANNLMVELVTKGIGASTRVLMPQNYAIIRGNTLSNNISASGSAGSTSLTTSGASGLKKGTFINFAQGEKIYMLTQDSAPNSLHIFPSLRAPVSGRRVFFRPNEVIGSFYFDNTNVQGMTYSDGILFQPENLRLVEVV